jgi:hypothetical protein
MRITLQAERSAWGDTQQATTSVVPDGPWGNALKPSSLA